MSTITIGSDAQGCYSFPSTKTGPDHYALKIRAVGYELDGPKAIDGRSPFPNNRFMVADFSQNTGLRGD